MMMIETQRFGKCNTVSAFTYIQCKLWINTFHRCISCNPKYVQCNFQHASGKDEQLLLVKVFWKESYISIKR